MMVIYFLIILFINYSLFKFNSSIAQKLNLHDKPDKIRKFHKKNIPITGGLIIFTNIFLFYFFYILSTFENLFLFNNSYEIHIFFLSSFFIFMIGFLDDKFNIVPIKKFALLCIVLIPTILIQDNLIIENIKVSFFEREFYLGNIGFFWSLLCFLLFINALNMFDGINLQVGLYSVLIAIFFISRNYYLVLFATLLISLSTFLFLNLKNKSFLGDSGSLLVAYIFGYFFIKLYNENETLYADQIVILMILPGLDLMRLFISRLFIKKNPFSPDRNHLHHILLRHYSQNVTIAVIQFLIATPILITAIYGHFLVMLISIIIIYSVIVIKLR